jgi:hypothetical protein
MPVILAIQEAEIGRIMVQSQPGQNSLKDPIWKKPSQKRVGGVAQGVGSEFKLQYLKKKKNSFKRLIAVTHTCDPSYSGSRH